MAYPTWAPDGSAVAFFDSKATYLYPVDGAAGAPRILPKSGDDVLVAPGWSPDGKRLSGIVARGGVYLPGLVLYSLERGAFERVTDRGNRWVWLPDGSGFLFEDRRRIYQLDLPSRQMREIGPAGLNPNPDEQRVFAVSKDGRRLYRVDNASEADVWQLRLP